MAESKFAELESEFRKAEGDAGATRRLLVREGREAQVYDLARRLASHYELDAELAYEVFAWMIETTIDIEVAYIRMRCAS